MRQMRLHPTNEEVERLRKLIEDDKLQQGKAAQILGWGLRQVQYLVKKHAMRTQRTGPRSGPGHPRWRGGKAIDNDGYVLVWTEEHENARRHSRYLFEHRLVMEQHLGRPLLPTEVVHHKNRDKQDNRIENLELFASNADHLRHELAGRIPNWTESGKQKLRRAALAKRRRHKEPDAPERPAEPLPSTD